MRTVYLSSAALAALLAVQPAHAQQAPQAAAQSEAATAGEASGEIVVTAAKRSENLQSVPI